jgi:hypothetical protein
LKKKKKKKKKEERIYAVKGTTVACGIMSTCLFMGISV